MVYWCWSTYLLIFRFSLHWGIQKKILRFYINITQQNENIQILFIVIIRSHYCVAVCYVFVLVLYVCIVYYIKNNTYISIIWLIFNFFYAHSAWLNIFMRIRGVASSHQNHCIVGIAYTIYKLYAQRLNSH